MENVRSGWTTEVEERQDKWYLTEGMDAESVEWEDLFQIGSPDEFTDTYFPEVYFYHYIRRYVATHAKERFVEIAKEYQCNLNETNGLEKFLDLLSEPSESDEKLKRKFTEVVSKILRENEAEIDQNTLKGILFSKDITLESFWPLAFGLKMSVEDVNLFLQRAFRREKLNPWEEREMLLLNTFTFGQGNLSEYYRQLSEVYEEVAELDAETEMSTLNTTYLSENIADYRIREHKVLEPFSPHSDEMKAHLGRLKGMLKHREDYQRTAVKKFLELYKQLERIMEADLKEYYQAKGDADMPTGKVMIYPAEGMNHFKKGTVFVERGGQVRYTLIEDVSMKEEEEGVLCVRALKAGEYGLLEKKSLFEFTEEKYRSLKGENRSKFKRGKKTSSEDPVEGKVYLHLSETVTIPKGTRLKSGDFLFETTEDFRHEVAIKGKIRCNRRDHYLKAGEFLQLAKQPERAVKIYNSVVQKQRGGKAFLPVLYYDDGEYVFERQFVHSNPRLLSSVLDGTKITPTDISNLKNNNAENISRSKLLSLIFMTYTSEKWNYYKKLEGTEEKEQMKKAFEDSTCVDISKSNARMRYEDFVLKSNDTLAKCGMEGIYLGNPYDMYLSYLLVAEDPLQAFRFLWGEYQHYCEVHSESEK